MTEKRSTAVSLRQISKSYGGRDVIDRLDLDVAPGEFLAILGPSGSGKTTTMRIIAGFEAPDSGTVRIAGRDVTTVPAERRDVNTVFQSYALFPHMSVRDNVAFGPRMRGVGQRERYGKADEMLALVHLTEWAASRPHELSGGMQQRVALARALANEPAVLLLDEPIGALDRQLREDMQRELRRVQSALGATFIYVTHDQEEAFGMADRIAVMRAGRFEQIGDPASVYDRPANAWVAEFVGSANRFAARLTAMNGQAQLTAAAGTLASCHIAPSLRPGASVVAMVRPEATRFEMAAGGPGEGVANRLPARLIDCVAVGPWLRLRARMKDGVDIESVARREAGASVPSPGDDVVVAFDANDLRVYAAAEGTDGSAENEGVSS